jgi:hypothetical protein
MKMVAVNWRPKDRQLRQFGLAALVLLPLGGWLLLGRPQILQANPIVQLILGGLLVLGSVFAILAVMRPQALRGVFIGFSLVTMPIGMVVGEAALLLIYFAVLFPIAMLLRLLGRDALQRRLDRGTTSYWQDKTQPANAREYFRQF